MRQLICSLMFILSFSSFAIAQQPTVASLQAKLNSLQDTVQTIYDQCISGTSCGRQSYDYLEERLCVASEANPECESLIQQATSALATLDLYLGTADSTFSSIASQMNTLLSTTIPTAQADIDSIESSGGTNQAAMNSLDATLTALLNASNTALADFNSGMTTYNNGLNQAESAAETAIANLEGGC